MRKFILVLLGIFLTVSGFAQFGKSFWFVAPDVTQKHGDEPLFFRVTTLDKGATVTISMPANSGFTTISRYVNANSQATIEVKKSDVENSPVNRVNNKGVFVESDQNITVYYEVANQGNPDKFTLKGENALGTDFYIPSQNAYRNWPNYDGDANEKIDIVAIEDGTEVTITPKVNVTGHKGGVPYTISLNRGQTYCVELRDISRSASLAGTHITSNKNIAITISDDSINESSHPHDLIGDQMIPVDVIGNEYIAIRANDDPMGTHKVFVLATEDDTHVFINNDTGLVRHLNKGEQTTFDITGSAIYIKSTKPVYAYQLSGLVNVKADGKANELGSALLPTVECTGSSLVAFTRIFIRSFWVQILTQGSNLNGFIMRDDQKNVVNSLDGISWKKVPGTDTKGADKTWYSAVINLNSISTGVPYTIENTKGLFHLSVMDENDPKSGPGSVSYGYFSSYGRMKVEGPNQACEGNVIVLRTSEEMNNYRWFADFATGVISTDETLAVNKTGKYWVTADMKFGGCTITDSLNVDFELPEVALGNDTTVCPGETLNYSAPAGYPVYNWSNSATGNSTSVLVTDGYSSTLSIEVTDDFGCKNSDAVVINAYAVPTLELNSPEVCEGQRIIATPGFATYRWVYNSKVINIDQTQNYITPNVSGVYHLTATTLNGCQVDKDFSVTVNSLPVFTFSDQKLCSGLSLRVNGPTGSGYTYLWQDGSTANHLDLNLPSSYTLTVKDSKGCDFSSTGNFSWYEPNPIDLGEDREECAGITLEIDNSADYHSFEWIYKTTASSSEVILPTPSPENRYEITSSKTTDSGIYGVRAVDKNGCPVDDEVSITFYDTNPPLLELKEELCSGESTEIKASTGYSSYKWYLNNVEIPAFADQTEIVVNTGGTYKVEASYLACLKTNEVEVTQHSLPTVDLKNDFSICTGGTGDITVTNFTAEAGSAFDYLVWNGGDDKIDDWTTASLTVNASGSYSVTAYDINGCSASDAVNVGVFTPEVFDLGVPKESCDGVNVLLESPLVTATSFEWYKIESDKDIAGPANTSWSVAQSGTYRVQLNDGNGCPGADTVVVKMLPSPSLDLGSDIELCQGETTVIGTTDSFNAYQWNGDPTLNTATIETGTAGTYLLSVTNSFGCSALDEVNVSVKPVTTFTIPDQSVCAGEEVFLTVPGGLSNFIWSTGETTSSIQVEKGKYWLKATMLNGCESTDTVLVNWYPVPKVNLGPDTIVCPLHGSVIIEAGTGFASYLWHNDSHAESIQADILDTINQVQVTNSYGCLGFDTKTVRYEIAPEMELISDTSICASEVFELDAGFGFLDYLWSDGDINQTKEVTIPGRYSVEVTDGCFIFRDTAEIVHFSEPVIAALDTSNYASVGVIATGGTAPYLYSMDMSTPQSASVFDGITNGLHDITVTDFNGCMAQLALEINNVIDIEVSPFITPNGDGENDRFKIIGIERFPDSIIKIYDRYGKLLAKYFASDDPWDGTYLGKPMPTDDYWYVIELVNVKKSLKGHVTLKR